MSDYYESMLTIILLIKFILTTVDRIVVIILQSLDEDPSSSSQRPGMMSSLESGMERFLRLSAATV